MTYRLPPLNALRAFEAAARHLSFKEAGRELFVTRGAVSQQVKALEAELGVRLFHRMTRQIALSEEGQALLPKVRQAFQLISSATEALRPEQRDTNLTISTFPSFAAKWLVPRLGSFTERHPKIDVRISATHEVVEFGRNAVDLAIRHGQSPSPGLHNDLLIHADIFPVCSPKLLDQGPPLREPADLRHHHLIHNRRAEEWNLWLQAHDVEGIDLTHGTRFSEDFLVLEAAINGQGIAISRDPLADADLASGRLIRPFLQATPNLFSYYLVCPPERANLPKIALFREWIVEEIRANPHWRG